MKSPKPAAASKRVVVLSHPHRRQLVLALLLTVLVVLLYSALLPNSTCEIAPPTVASHRGFDVNASAGGGPSVASIAALLHAGVRSFDVDLFWTVDESAGFFVGHPPSLLQRLGLSPPLSQYSSGALRQRSQAALLPLSELLALAKRSVAQIDQISLELKEPEHYLWAQKLLSMYNQIAASGVAHKLALTATSARQAEQHRRAQASARISLQLHLVVRDVDARLHHSDGSPRVDMDRLVQEAAQLGVAYAGWSVSAKLVDAELLASAAAQRTPVSVWVVDDEATLRRTWRMGAKTIITNQPLWAGEMLLRWYSEACGSSPTARRRE